MAESKSSRTAFCVGHEHYRLIVGLKRFVVSLQTPLLSIGLCAGLASGAFAQLSSLGGTSGGLGGLGGGNSIGNVGSGMGSLGGMAATSANATGSKIPAEWAPRPLSFGGGANAESPFTSAGLGAVNLGGGMSSVGAIGTAGNTGAAGTAALAGAAMNRNMMMGGMGGQRGMNQNNRSQQNQKDDRKIRATVRLGFNVPVPTSNARSQVINTRLSKIPNIAIDGITVVVSGRQAIIRGNAATTEDGRMIERLLSLEPGIDGVTNELTYTSEPEAVDALAAPENTNAGTARAVPLIPPAVVPIVPPAVEPLQLAPRQ